MTQKVDKGTLSAGSRLNFKYIVLSRLDELVNLSYIVGKVQISSFSPSHNHIQNPPIS
jgi:hypothetical protein